MICCVYSPVSDVPKQMYINVKIEVHEPLPFNWELQHQTRDYLMHNTHQHFGRVCIIVNHVCCCQDFSFFTQHKSVLLVLVAAVLGCWENQEVRCSLLWEC